MSNKSFSAISKLNSFEEYLEVSVWIRKFELAAKIDEVPKEKLTEYVFILLSDEVYKKAINAGISEHSEYSEIKKFLQDNYSENENFFSLQNKFHTMEQSYEDVQTFADNISVTGKKAYEEAPERLLNNILCHQFVKGLKSLDIKKNLLMSGDMNNFKKMVASAVRIESTLSLKDSDNYSESTENNDDLKNNYKNLEEKLQKLTDMIMDGGYGGRKSRK